MIAMLVVACVGAAAVGALLVIHALDVRAAREARRLQEQPASSTAVALALWLLLAAGGGGVVAVAVVAGDRRRVQTPPGISQPAPDLGAPLCPPEEHHGSLVAEPAEEVIAEPTTPEMEPLL